MKQKSKQPQPKKQHGGAREHPGGAAPGTPGARLKAARALRGLRQEDLTEASGVSVGHLCNIERGKRDIDSLKVGTLVKIGSALDLSLDYIVNGKGVDAGPERTRT